MRASYVLFLCGAILASGCAQSTASGAMISTMASPELMRSDENNARNLRGLKELEDKEEDRVLTLSKLSWEKLENIYTNSKNIQATKFAKWKAKNMDQADILRKIRAFDSTNERHWGIAAAYAQYLKDGTVTAPGSIKRMEQPPARPAPVEHVPNENSLILKGLWNWMTGTE